MAKFDGGQAARLLPTCGGSASSRSSVGQLTRAGEIDGLIHLSIRPGGRRGRSLHAAPRRRPRLLGTPRARARDRKGSEPSSGCMAELMGRDTGLCRGLGGSMHLVDAEHGFMGATGVVGGNVPIALGSALASRLRGTDAVAVVFFGDGAVQAGHFIETVNLATLWGLPLVLVCENNGFAEFTPRSAHTVVERVSDVVAPYGLERATVDGNDVSRGVGSVRAIPRCRADGRRAVPARVPDAPCCAGTTRATRPLPRGARRGRVAARRTRSSGSSARDSRRAGSTRRRSARSRPRPPRRSSAPCASRGRARSRRPT